MTETYTLTISDNSVPQGEQLNYAHVIYNTVLNRTYKFYHKIDDGTWVSDGQLTSTTEGATLTQNGSLSTSGLEVGTHTLYGKVEIYENETQITTLYDQKDFTIETPPPPPHFSLTLLSESEVSANQGDMIPVEIRIENDGGTTGDYTLVLYVDGEPEESISEGTMGAGDIIDMTVNYIVDLTVGQHILEFKIWNIDQQTWDDTVTITLNVTGGTEPFFAIEDTSNIVGSPGEEVTIYVSVKNVGSQTGSGIVKIFDHNNTEVGSNGFSDLAPGNSMVVQVQVTLPTETGTYTWTSKTYRIINESQTEENDNDQFTVKVSDEPYFSLSSPITEYNIGENDTVTVNIRIENTGTQPGDYTLYRSINGGSEIVLGQGTLDPSQYTTMTDSIGSQYFNTGENHIYYRAYNRTTGKTNDILDITVNKSTANLEIYEYPDTVTVQKGTQTQIAVGIRNSGTAPGTGYVKIFDNNGYNAIVGQEYVTYNNISPNTTLTQNITIQAPDSVGSYTYTIKLYKDTNFTTILDQKSFILETEENAPHFRIESINKPSTATDTYTIDILIQNDGNISGDVAVQLTVKCQETTVYSDSAIITIPAGNTTQVTFTVTPNSESCELENTITLTNTTTSNIDDQTTFTVSFTKTQTTTTTQKFTLDAKTIVAVTIGVSLLSSILKPKR